MIIKIVLLHNLRHLCKNCLLHIDYESLFKRARSLEYYRLFFEIFVSINLKADETLLQIFFTEEGDTNSSENRSGAHICKYQKKTKGFFFYVWKKEYSHTNKPAKYP